MRNDTKKKLLLVTSGFPFGQTERGFLLTEFHQLCKQFDVSILSIGSKEPLLYPLEEEVTVERFAYGPLLGSLSGMAGMIMSLFSPRVIGEMFRAAKGQSLRGVLRRGKQILAYRANARDIQKRMDRIIRERKIDLIYTYWCTEATLAAVDLKKNHPGLKVVTRFHGYDLYHHRSLTGRQPFRAEIADKIDRLFFSCKMGQDYFLEHWGSRFARKAQVCYLGSPGQLPVEQYESDTLSLVSCSNLIPLKRVELIIDGLACLPASVKVRWNHFGDGVLRPELEKRAAEKLDSLENVQWQFRGQVPNHEITEHYRRVGVQLFLTTSSTEGGVPVSLQEIIAMGVPAVGTDVGGIPDLVIHNKTGFLLPAECRAEDVAAAITDFTKLTLEQRQQMSCEAAALWKTCFDAEANARSFCAGLQELLHK